MSDSSMERTLASQILWGNVSSGFPLRPLPSMRLVDVAIHMHRCVRRWKSLGKGRLIRTAPLTLMDPLFGPRIMQLQEVSYVITVGIVLQHLPATWEHVP
ncbi:hypothetical protein LINGRAHAP2_LOCUS30582 [Linum grandiflorum]